MGMAAMSDDDPIRRGDALAACSEVHTTGKAHGTQGILAAIAALPAVSAPVAVRVKPLEWEDHGEVFSTFDNLCGCMIYAEGHDEKKREENARAARIMAAIDAPDVAELVEAAKGVMRHMPDYADTAWQELDAALARIGGQ